MFHFEDNDMSAPVTDDEEGDERPESDFATTTGDIHAPQIDQGKLATALTRVGSNDPNVHEIITVLETIRQAYGDKDEMLARYADDLEGGICLLLLELHAHPAAAAARAIAQLPPDRQGEELQIMYRFLEARVRAMSAPVDEG